MTDDKREGGQPKTCDKNVRSEIFQVLPVKTFVLKQKKGFHEQTTGQNVLKFGKIVKLWFNVQKIETWQFLGRHNSLLRQDASRAFHGNLPTRQQLEQQLYTKFKINEKKRFAWTETEKKTGTNSHFSWKARLSHSPTFLSLQTKKKKYLLNFEIRIPPWKSGKVARFLIFMDLEHSTEFFGSICQN